MVFDIKAIEAGVKAGDFKTINGVRRYSMAVRARNTRATFRSLTVRMALTRHRMASISLLQASLSPTVTVLDVRKLPDLFNDKIGPRDVVVAEPELGLGSIAYSL